MVNLSFLLVTLMLIPLSSPLWLKVSRMANGLIWNVPLPLVAVFLLHLLVNFSLMRIKAPVGIFFWYAQWRWQLLLPVMCPLIVGLLLISLYVLSFPSPLGMLLLIGLERILLFGLLVGFSLPIVRVLLRPQRFVIFGMFTSVRLALFLLLFVRSFFVFVALQM